MRFSKSNLLALLLSALSGCARTNTPVSPELAAIRHVIEIVEAQRQFKYETNRFARSMNELEGVGLFGAVRGGYHFRVRRTLTGFAANADPLEFGKTGRRTFYSDETGILRENWSRDPATALSKIVK